MNVLTALVLLGFSTDAKAGTPFYQPFSYSESFSEWKMADYMGSVNSIEIEGTIDIPLFATTSGQPELLTYVGTSADDDGELFLIAPGSSLIVVTEGFAKDNELEIKVGNKRLIPVPDDFLAGGEVKYVKIPELHVGGMILSDVIAFVSGSESKSIDSTGHLNFKKASIGLGALDISYAILESKGVLRVTQSELGPKLASALGGTTVPYQEMGWGIGTVGKWSLSGKSKVVTPALSLIVPASFGAETEVHTLLSFHSRSELDSYYPVGESNTSIFVNDMRYDWLSPTIAGQKMNAAPVARLAAMDIDAPSPTASIGANILSRYDVVVDKSTQSITFSPADGRLRQSSLDIELQRAKDALNTPKEESAEAVSESEEPSLNVGGLKKVIGLLEKSNQYEATLLHYDALLADKEEVTDCSLWLDYAHTQRKLGDMNKALEAYTEASRLYHSWWSLDLHQRMDINNAQSDANDLEIESAKTLSEGQAINTVEDGWYISQPESCYVADGFVAYSHMLTGNLDNVEPIYRSRLDLDGHLARALGHTALLNNNTEKAHEAYRQAIRLEDGRNERRINRIALAIVYADQGKWDQSNALFQEAMALESRRSQDALTPQIWLDQARHLAGEEAALTAINGWLEVHPMDIGAHIARLREYTLQANGTQEELSTTQGQSTEDLDDIELSNELEESTNELLANQQALDAGLKEAIDLAKLAFAALDSYDSTHSTKAQALRVQLLAFSGEIEAAKSLMSSIDNQYHPEVSLAQANLYALQGQVEEAQKALNNAARYNPSHPGYALLIK